MMCSNNRMNVYFFIFVICFSIYKFSSATKKCSTHTKTPQYLEKLLRKEEYACFAKILKIPNTHLINATQRKAFYLESFVFNGLPYVDILMRPGQVLNPDQESDFNGIVDLSINKWENGTVPYYIADNYSDDERRYIENEIAYNNRVLGPNIKIRPYKRGDKDYVLIYKGGSGCFTNLGKVGGPQSICLDSECLLDGFLTHEMQHTLGFGHETNRNDRDDHLQIIPRNIPEIFITAYEKYSAKGLINVGPFDHYSIMVFPTLVPGSDLKAYNVLDDGIDESKIGNFSALLSPNDIQRTKTVYSMN